MDGNLFPAALRIEPRCRTCNSPDREQIEAWMQAGHAAREVERYLRHQGYEAPSRKSLATHNSRHMIPSHSPEGIVAMALGQGSRQLRRGQIEMTATALASFLQLQRKIQVQGREKASEEMAARATNYILTALRSHMTPDQFYAFKDEMWPGLLEVVRGELIAAQPGPETPPRAPAT